MATKEVIELLNRFIVLLNAEGISISHAYLFGSHSTGKATIDSDIDVMLVSDTLDENNDEIVGKIWRLTRKIDTRIEPFLINKSRLTGDVSPLIAEVQLNGIAIC